MGYYSLYAESRHIKVMNNTTLDIKVALDGYKDGFTISQVDYMIIGAYSWKPDIVFHGSIERKLELPEFRQAYIIQDYMDINSECLPQKIARSKLSCSWHLSEEVSLTGSIFAGQIKDYITWELATNTATLSTDTPAGMLYEPVNIGDISIIGIELGLKHNLTEKLSQSINFIHSSYKNKTNGNNVVPYVPETTLSIGLKYVDDNHLMVSLEGEYVSKRYVTCEDKNKTLRSYFLVNLYGNKQVNDTLSIVFSWENILDETYEIRAGYPGMPCIATVGLHLKF
jgi:outer membrane cobalamin receptor